MKRLIMNEENEEKTYTVFRKVVVWEEWEIHASSEEEAIQKAKDGDADDYIGISECGENYLYPDEDGIVRYTSNDPTVEMYSRGESYDLIWDNTPVSIIREKKLNELLGE